MFTRHGDDGFEGAAPGIHMKTLCFGGDTLMTEFRLERGATLPRHAHPQEQTGYLVHGHIALTIGADTHKPSLGTAGASRAVSTTARRS